MPSVKLWRTTNTSPARFDWIAGRSRHSAPPRVHCHGDHGHERSVSLPDRFKLDLPSGLDRDAAGGLRSGLPGRFSLNASSTSTESVVFHRHDCSPTKSIVILSAAFRPAKLDESERRTYAFLARAPSWSESSSACFEEMHRSFVGSLSLREGLRFLRITATPESCAG